MNKEVIKVINQHLIETIHTWMPDVKKTSQGYQACNPIRGDRNPSSMTIYNDGKAFDFAANQALDCINLWAAQNGMDNKEAIKFHSEKLGLNPKQNYLLNQKPKFQVLNNEIENNALPLPPEPYPLNAFTHQKYDTPSLIHTYFDISGNLIGYTCRFDTKDGGKVVLPFTWSDTVGKNPDGSLKNGKLNWRWNAHGWKSWPIFGIERLNKNNNQTVVICEGEKTADAAQKLLPDCIVLSWAGGVSKAPKVNWDVLKGRRIVIWPDADAKENSVTGERLPWFEQPGMKAALSIAKALKSENPKIVIPPINVADGWDLADASDEGWTGLKVFEHITHSAFYDHELDEKCGARPKQNNEKLDSIKIFDVLETSINPLIVTKYEKNYRGEDKPAIDVPRTIEKYITEFIVNKFNAQEDFVLKNTNQDEALSYKKLVIAKRTSQIKTQKSLLTQIWCDCDNVIKKSATREAIENHFANIMEKKREEALIDLQNKLTWDGTDFDTLLMTTTIWLGHALAKGDEFLSKNFDEYEPQARALLHFAWQVKRKLYGVQAEMHMAPILLGDQGNGKSEFIRNLVKIFSVPFGNFVRDAYVDEIGEEKNEAILARSLINILDEMAGASKAEFNKVKNFITRFKVNPREFHSQHTMGEIINLSTFIGAANVYNLSEILHDESGNRRFFPINIVGFVNKKFIYNGEFSDLIKNKLPWIKSTSECFPYSFDSTPFWKMINHEWPCFIKTDAIQKIQSEHKYEPLKQWISNFSAEFLSQNDYKSLCWKTEKPEVQLVSTGFLREIFVTMFKLNPLEAKKWNLMRFAIELRKLGIESWVKNERGVFYKHTVCAIIADWSQIEGKIRLPWKD